MFMADELRVTDTFQGPRIAARGRQGGGCVVADCLWDYEWGREGGDEFGVHTRILGIRLWIGTQGCAYSFSSGEKGDAASSWLEVRVILQNSLGILRVEYCGRSTR